MNIKRDQLVVDIGPYTPSIDPDILADAGIANIIIKSSTDSRLVNFFESNARKVLDNGRLRLMIYHWIDPIGNWQTESAFLVDLIKQWPDVACVWMDIEQYWSNWGTWWQAMQQKIAWELVGKYNGQHISNTAEWIISEVLTKTGVAVGNYSSRTFIHEYTPQCNAWLGALPFWAAHYGNQPKQQVEATWDELKANWLPTYEPLIPDGVPANMCVGHQFTGDRFRLPGMFWDEAETRNAMADVNVFNADFLDSLPSSVGYVPPVTPPDEPEPEEEEPTMTKWTNYPLLLGAKCWTKETMINYTKPDTSKDGLIVSLGNDYEDINEMVGPQIDAAHEAGIPAIGVFRPDVKDYVQKTEGIYYENWKPDEDPFVNKLWYKYYLDRLVAQGVDAVMLDIVVSEGDGVVMTSWYIAVARYYINLMSERCNLPAWFLFLRTSDYDALAAKQVDGELDNFLHWAGSVCGLKIVSTDDVYPAQDATPEMIAPAIDFWLYDVSGASPLWLYCNGNKAALYALLDWKGTETTDDTPTDDDDDTGSDDQTGDDDQTGETPVIGDLSAVMDAIETVQVGQDEMNAKLDRIMEFIEGVKDA